MSSAKPKAVAEIDLEEFERRLRASAAPQAGVEDPLAELTRLVDTIGFERTPSERALEFSRTPKAVAKPDPSPPPANSGASLTPSAPKPNLGVSPPPKPSLALAPPETSAAPSPKPQTLSLAPPEPAATPARESEPAPPALQAAPPLADAEPPLRPSFDEDLDSLAFEPPSRAGSAEYSGEQDSAPPLAVASERPAPRARHWGLKVGGLIAAAAVMTGAVVVFMVGGHARTGAPPLILASTAPTKVAPPSDETIRTANESGSLLTRDTAQPTPTPPKLVSPPEAPVDLSARSQPASKAAAGGESSPVAPSTDTPLLAAAAPTATPISPVSADPSRVKTISVRPDGTLISSGYEAANPGPAASPTPAPTAKRELADGEAASPAVALPTKLSPPKSAARVVAKTDTTAPADSGAGPVPVTPKPKKPKPAPTPAVAEAEPKTDDAVAPPSPGGGYAVQLAAPKSEGEAKTLIKSLQGRYSDALSGASLAVRKAERNGEAIYRVRAVGLSKADAAAMCAKVKSAGGDCYVAKN